MTVLIRDPLWDTIRLDDLAVQIVDSPAFQRLRYIRQLGLAHLVYPGASHTRFDHAIGVYHLAQRALQLLREHRAIREVSNDDVAVIPYAGLLHDIGHYPFSHALEELEAEHIPIDHESLVGHFLNDERVRAALGEGTSKAIEALVRGKSANPLQGLVSGSLDLDKIDYLKRDAFFCGVPYGEVDVDRLLHALAIVRDPETGTLEVGVHEKGVASLESLLFAKYQMFRNVYWHHAVRAATVMYKRIVADAIEHGVVTSTELIGQTDEGVLFLIESRNPDDPRVRQLRARELPKRAGELVATEFAELKLDSAAAEQKLARELGVRAADVYVDYPEKKAMFSLDLLVEKRNGEVLRLGPAGRAGMIGLPRISEELYSTARVLRVFVSGKRFSLDESRLREIVLS
jgi:uncharacterized protein